MMLPMWIAVLLALAPMPLANPFSDQGTTKAPLPKYLLAAPASEAVVAKVNGVPIYAKDVNQVLWDWRGTEAIQEMIFYRLIDQEAKKLGAKVTDAQIEAEIAKRKKAFAEQSKDGKTFAQMLDEQRLSLSRFYEGVRIELLVDRIVVQKFNPNEFVRVYTILVKPADASTGSLSDALKAADKAYADLKAGKSWDSVLESAVSDPNAKKNRGFLGWRNLSAFPDIVQKELKTMKSGDITKPAQTQFGIQIFRLEALGSALKGADLTDLREQYLASARQTYVQELRDRSKIEILWPKKS